MRKSDVRMPEFSNRLLPDPTNASHTAIGARDQSEMSPSTVDVPVIN
jgi:hypothetical protein